ncbi:Lipoprotein-releasing system ATP-binding protein LolD [Anaerohalosphaera lusitana]|uniref:Lipoprotein-releasing system ATP-binding protein LolD n=1 Tax=Anaerohalosphaera lusitana TaxID=1936003 RepID=A0A1U9NRW7_9BACT|nr:ABC transporter ATP-binding protein [Anaerohalosphaera lusitana]AQT70266.1 Lipoprotein-releasing system ATP-binding protein LolD [Anaerohalosphaera lusitana]
MPKILKASSIYKSYRMGQAKLDVLKGLDLSIKEGEFVAIVGSSGSGKSTLLHILGALDKVDKGRVQFRGKDLDKFSVMDYARFRNKMVGFVFQFYHLLDELNVLENVLLPSMAGTGMFGWAARKKTAVERAEMLLDKMGLSERLKHKAYQLSGGERQRVAIARALMNNPVLLLADEPTGNLDSVTGNGILESLAHFNAEGQTIVMVTHDDRVAQKADRTIRLVDGKIARL